MVPEEKHWTRNVRRIKMNEFKEEPYTMPEPTLKEKVDRLTDLLEKKEEPIKKVKKFRMPFKGRLSKRKLREGYATVLAISENNGADFKREKIVDGTVKLGDTFHAVSELDFLTYKGRPLLIIPRKSKFPYNPNVVENDTFGQKHIMSRMVNEVIGTGKKLGLAGMSIGAIILGGVLIYALVAG